MGPGAGSAGDGAADPGRDRRISLEVRHVPTAVGVSETFWVECDGAERTNRTPASWPCRRTRCGSRITGSTRPRAPVAVFDGDRSELFPGAPARTRAPTIRCGSRRPVEPGRYVLAGDDGAGVGRVVRERPAGDRARVRGDRAASLDGIFAAVEELMTHLDLVETASPPAAQLHIHDSRSQEPLPDLLVPGSAEKSLPALTAGWHEGGLRVVKPSARVGLLPYETASASTGRFAASHAAMPPAISLTSAKP